MTGGLVEHSGSSANGSGEWRRAPTPTSGRPDYTLNTVVDAATAATALGE